MAALAAFVIAVLALFGVGAPHFMLLLWAAAVALHLLIGFYPLGPVGWRRSST